MKITLKRTDHSTDLYLTLDVKGSNGSDLNGSDLKGSDLRAAIVDTYDFNPDMLMVHAGKVIDNEDILDIEDNSTVVLAKWRHSKSKVNIHNQIFNRIHLIAAKNPYFLSYMAVKPEKAQEILEQEFPDLKTN
jgi:hypothetical protein